LKLTATVFAFATMFTVTCHGAAAGPGETITPEIMAAIESEALIVDVRTPDEYADGHYPGAINIPHDTILEGLEQLGVTEETPVILYCRSGNRSGQAEQALQKKGFTEARNAGGLEALLSATAREASLPTPTASPE
jgi:phage shock protein E